MVNQKRLYFCPFVDTCFLFDHMCLDSSFTHQLKIEVSSNQAHAGMCYLERFYFMVALSHGITWLSGNQFLSDHWS